MALWVCGRRGAPSKRSGISTASGSGRCQRPGACAAQAIAGEVDALRVVHQAVEDGVGVGRIADHGVPLVDRQLAGEDGGAPAVAFLEDLQQIVPGAGVERGEAPVVEDEDVDLRPASKIAQPVPLLKFTRSRPPWRPRC